MTLGRLSRYRQARQDSLPHLPIRQSRLSLPHHHNAREPFTCPQVLSSPRATGLGLGRWLVSLIALAEVKHLRVFSEANSLRDVAEVDQKVRRQICVSEATLKAGLLKNVSEAHDFRLLTVALVYYFSIILRALFQIQYLLLGFERANLHFDCFYR